jgi:IS30 family transposase
MDFRAITDEEVQAVEDRLNNRPRKLHGYLTPNQVFFKSTIALKT